MKSDKHHIGNIVIVADRPLGQRGLKIVLGLKPARRKEDKSRSRKRVGIGKWVPPGGGSEDSDRSLKHGTARELLQETGFKVPIAAFRKIGKLEGKFQGGAWTVHIYCAILPNRPTPVFDRNEYVEMRWFDAKALPTNQMIATDLKWLPLLLGGKLLSIKICFVGPAGSESTQVSIQETRFH